MNSAECVADVRVCVLSAQTVVNHKQLSVLFNRCCGKAGGNCELRAISFMALCNCQCRREAEGMEGDGILLLFMLWSHMVSTPALRAGYEHRECETKAPAKLRARPFSVTVP